MISSEDFFKDIHEDRIHGASWLYNKFLTLFDTYIHQVDEITPQYLESLPAKVVAIRDDMAPFYYAALRLSECLADCQKQDESAVEVLLALIKEMKIEQEEALDKIQNNMRTIIDQQKKIMLHSYSHTVATVVRSIFNDDVNIFLSESYPDCEGKNLAKELSGAGFKVTLIPDDAKSFYLKDIDLVLLGSDWIAENDFTNKIGSYSMTLAAVNDNKPVYVVSDGSKIVPAKLRQPRDIKRIRLAKNLYKETPLFEEIDNQLVDHFITDLGIFTPSEVQGFVETRLKYVNFKLSQFPLNS